MRKLDFQNKTHGELSSLLLGKRAAVRELRFEKAAGKLKNPHKLREARRDVARIATFLKQAPNQ